jgi:1,4-dihydroxy-2-naphthoate octaprenyltransferase
VSVELVAGLLVTLVMVLAFSAALALGAIVGWFALRALVDWWNQYADDEDDTNL